MKFQLKLFQYSFYFNIFNKEDVKQYAFYQPKTVEVILNKKKFIKLYFIIS